ncbi:hypothetical protein ABZ412_22385 [Nocardia sp. NPDC005746]|uniref:hypothetical protein n=1 Tax=Nocardia sp. NPDC005746 TaxID=3157062 RepID=UPI0033F285E9
MHITPRTLRHIRWGATTLALAATISALAAPAEAAEVGPIQVGGCPGPTCVTSYHVGDTYMIWSPVNDGLYGSVDVYFYDNGQCIGHTPTPSGQGTLGGGGAYLNWVPATTGTHKITVQQGIESSDVTVTVVAATTPGPAPEPPHGDCSGAGLIGTGSGLAHTGSSVIAPLIQSLSAGR